MHVMASLTLVFHMSDARLLRAAQQPLPNRWNTCVCVREFIRDIQVCMHACEHVCLHVCMRQPRSVGRCMCARIDGSEQSMVDGYGAIDERDLGA